MDGFEQKLIEFNSKNNLIIKGDRVLVGVSGGADSMALLQFLMKQKNILKLNIIVAHFNHMFRGEESDGDEAFVKEFCEKHSIIFISRQKNIPKIILESGDNSQLTSRNHRYAFYQEIMEVEAIDKLILAHHLDDLAENVLMNLARGVDTPKKIGIPVERQFGNAKIVRPFMCVSKEEIINYLEKENIAFREDVSNKSLKYTRNRIRHNIIPQLKEENNKSLQHIADFYEQIKNDDDYIQNQTRNAFHQIKIECDRGIYSIEIKAILEVDKPLQRRLFHLILEYVFSKKKSNFVNKHIDALFELAKGSQSSSIFEIEQTYFVEKSFDKLLFYIGKKKSEYFEMELLMPGITQLPNGDSFEVEGIDDVTEVTDDAYISSEGLIVRSRIDGDRIHVDGLGHKKLKKMFSEKKIPIYRRDDWPILSRVENKSDIVWVPHIFEKKLDVGNRQLFKIKFNKHKGEV